jgi:outer membrane receptor protein involved in Fe transport
MTMNNNSLRLLLIAAVITVFTAPLATLAQDEQEADFLIMEEVIVTAQKREQLLRDVPLSISALTGGDIEKPDGNEQLSQFSSRRNHD